jgi:hypothetical protein
MPRVPFVERQVTKGPVAAPLSTTRASGEDFGANVGAATAQLGGQVRQTAEQANQLADLAARKQAMEATNAYQEEAGKADIAFRSLQGNQVTPEAMALHLEALKQAGTKYRENLSPRAAKLYDNVVGRDTVAKHLDTEQHFVKQTLIATEQARVAQLETSANEAISKGATFQGRAAMNRVAAAIAQDPKLKGNNDAVNAAIGQAFSGITAAQVSQALVEGDTELAQEFAKHAEEAGYLTPEAKLQITARIKTATESTKVDMFARDLAVTAAKEFPNPRDLESQEAFAIDEIEAQVKAGDLSVDEARSRTSRVSQLFSEQRQRLAVADREFTKAATAQIEQAGTIGAARNYIESLDQDKKDIFGPALERMAVARYARSAADAEREDAQRSADPSRVSRYEALLLKGIQTKVTSDPEVLRTQVEMLHLPRSSLTKLQGALANDGRLNGISQQDILSNMTAAQRKQFDPKEKAGNEEKLFALQDLISSMSPEDKPLDAKSIREKISMALYEGALEAGKGKAATYFDAVQAGQESQWRPNLTESAADLAKGTMRNRADDIRAKRAIAIKEGRHEEAEALRVQAAALDPDPLTYIPPSAEYPNGSYVPAEEDSLDRERAYVQVQITGTTPGISRRRQQRREGQEVLDTLSRLGTVEAARKQADATLAEAIDAATYKGTYGVGALRRQLADSLQKSEVPQWLEDHRTAYGLPSLRTKPASVSDAEWRIEVTTQALIAINQVTGD